MSMQLYYKRGGPCLLSRWKHSMQAYIHNKGYEEAEEIAKIVDMIPSSRRIDTLYSPHKPRLNLLV